MEIVARRITITGVVQGVGFRPFVYNLAQQLGLHGWVLNHSGGVDIEVEGPPATVKSFVAALRDEAPPLAHIETLEAEAIAPQGHAEFEIRHSEAQAGRYQLISPDVATCDDCLRELFDPTDRRYRYPFINCTNCGPRFTIIQDIPYDRPKTTMRVFPLCDDCRAEYEDPADRRFHAQPNACPVCGPHIWLTDEAGQPLAGGEETRQTEAVLARAKHMLLAGRILAIKGLGGFHLACDATDAEAVERLRERKRRPHKAFAVMVATLDDARAHCRVTPAAEALLGSAPCPIVLMERRAGSPIAQNVAPNSHTMGLMVPYTPLHHLLLRDVDRPLVMTSGNVTEEPIAKENPEALRRLAPLANGFLFHNREIYARYDDSVWHVVELGPSRELAQPLRRARGYAPFPIRLPFEAAPTFAAGPMLKNTFCLTRDRHAFLSQHIGDLEDLETLAHYESALATYQHLFRIEPERVACDLHPDYVSTRFAEAFAAERGLPAPMRVQHHHAHIAACLVEHGRTPEDGPIIGVALDGSGYGEDGTIWGGEWFVGGYDGFRRVAHLQRLPLPGGDAATRRPWRIGVAYAHTLLGADRVPADLASESKRELITQQIDRRLNTPETSSMGRLFDAVSALLGVCRETTYEAQAAIELEQRVAPDAPLTEPPYPFEIEPGDDGHVIQLAPLFEALLAEIERDVPVPTITLRFHATVAHMVVQVCELIRRETGLSTVAPSGGVFQNRLLLRLVIPQLEAAGFELLLHTQAPPNDGCIALGQAALAQFM